MMILFRAFPVARPELMDVPSSSLVAHHTGAAARCPP